MLPWQPHGYIQQVHVRLVFDGIQGVNITAGLEFQQLRWPAAGARLRPGWSTSRCACKGQWQDNQWSCETLTIEAPSGRFALHDRAWIQADEDAWHGHMAFALDIQDSQTVTWALPRAVPGHAYTRSLAHCGTG